MSDNSTTPAHGDFHLEFAADQWVVSKFYFSDKSKSIRRKPTSYHNRFSHAMEWLSDRLVGYALHGMYPRIFLESPAEVDQEGLDAYVEALAGVTRRFTMSKQQNGGAL